MTTTSEILRAAAAIVDASWCAEHDAADAQGAKVDLYKPGVGDTGRASLNPDAVRFSAYGAITKATVEAPKGRATLVMWDALRSAALAAGARGPTALSYYNRMEGRTAGEVSALLRAVADDLEQPA